MNEPERESIQPEDWPLEEGGTQAQDGLRGDVGASQGRPKEEQVDDDRSTDAAQEHAGDVVGSARTGTYTGGGKGAEQGPR